ncbi:MAG: CCA tRNA nucleotidyltransferase [Bdellovibrionales bacterium]
MNKVKSITPPDWMTDSNTQKIMTLLGQEQTMFVGGCVRNTLLGEDVSDIDIATKHHPEQVMKLLKAGGVKTIPTGIDHGTVTAVIDKQSFEITTLRKDVATDGRRATIAFSDSWEKDAERRDFTINTLLADSDGNIYDPTGQGINDLNNRTIKFVGDPEQRILEDILRILRLFRFHALYGSGAIENETLKACAKHADRIKTLSKERITQECLKIISVDNPVDILRIMFDHNILSDFANTPASLETLKHLCVFQHRYNLAFIASRLWTLAGFDQSNLEAMQNYLLLPKVFKKDIAAIDAVLKLPDLSNDHAVKVAIYKHGRVPTAQALIIELATDRVMNGYAPIAIKIIQNWNIPTFPVSGDDLIKEGIPKGPQLGAELNKREEAWIKNGFK